MTSHERVKKAIQFGGPDRIPHYLPDGLENDIIWLWFGQPPDKMPWTSLSDGRKRRIDAWGVTWETMGGGSFGEAVSWPLADIVGQDDYEMPGLHLPEYFESAKAAIASNRASANPRYCLGVMPYSSLHEGTHNLMGLPNLLVGYYTKPDELRRWFRRLAARQRESIEVLAGIGCDGVMGYDDWGLQDRLMVSPDIFREFYLENYRENWATAHSLGMDVWLHSCGFIVELLPMLIEAGLNVVQMDQQENMGLEVLDAAAGGKLAFWCPVDIQKTMVEGDPAGIEAYVRRMMATIGSHRGGLVSMAYSSPEAVGHSKENIAAMCSAFREYGRYGARHERS